MLKIKQQCIGRIRAKRAHSLKGKATLARPDRSVEHEYLPMDVFIEPRRIK